VEDGFVMLHGGVPSKAKTVDDVAYAFQKHPAESHLEEILWSDPAEIIKGTRFSFRGAGRFFGEDVTDAFLRMTGARILVRGHEPVEGGYAFNHNGKVLTIFSRKGPPYNNTKGAYLHVDLSKKFSSATHLGEYIKQF
jgi:diadenosine tetraphosphatase ApaH/serine/threonine PP2A family protein phosphatase